MLFLWLLACTTQTEDDALPPPPGEGVLTALTYNVHGLPDPLTDTERPTGERMLRIAPMLEDFDIVGLQEDFDPDHHDALAADASHPTREWFDDVVEADRVYGAGLALLAREGSMSEYREEHYTDCNGVFDGASDCLASKGFHVLSLDLGGGAILDVYNTHHEAGGGAEDDAARRAQVQQALASIDGPSAGHAILFMGDFNLRWTDPEDVDELQLYVDAGLRDACDEVGCPEEHIDRFWVRDGDTVELDVLAWARDTSFVDEDGVDLSDHPAITIELSWQRR